MSAVEFVFVPLVLALVLALFFRGDSSVSKYTSLVLFGFMLSFSVGLFEQLPS